MCVRERVCVCVFLLVCSLDLINCSVFEAFGKVTKVDLAPGNMASKHRGWGFINYASHKSAQDAITSMNLFDLGGQFLRIRGVSVSFDISFYLSILFPLSPCRH